MGKPFKLRSQGAVKKYGFKMMGSSPYKDTTERDPHGHDHDDAGNEIKWSEEKLISEQKKETDKDITTTKEYETKGESKGYTATKTIQQAFKDWKKDNPNGTYEEFKKQKDEWIKSQKKEHTKTREDKDVEKKKKKKCECQAYKADGSKGPMVEYPCDGPKNPNCEPPTEKKGSTCQCMNVKTRKMITYKCPEPGCKCPKPAECTAKKNGGGGKKKFTINWDIIPHKFRKFFSKRGNKGICLSDNCADLW